MKAQLTAAHLDTHCMPFTANCSFKKEFPVTSKASRAYLIGSSMDCRAWMLGAAPLPAEITAAAQEQGATIDYAPAYQFAHTKTLDNTARDGSVMSAKSMSRQIANILWLPAP